MARPARRPADENQRIARLRALSVLDTEAEPLFDALTRVAALVAGVQIALVSLIDAERQWFKANHGLEGTSETPRDAAFCAHTILGDSILEVNDARLDERFADNPLVTGGPGIRFYAGAPIVLHDGVRVGSLCVIDREPRVLSIDQRRVLTALAKVASEALEQRALGFERNAALQREADAGAKLAQIVKATDAATSEWNVRTGEVRYNARWAQLMGKTAAHLLSTSAQPWLEDVHPEDRLRLQSLLERHLRGELPEYDAETRISHQDGRWIWVRDRARATSGAYGGEAQWMYGTRVDIDARKRAELALAASEARARALYEATPAMMNSIDMRSRLLAVSDLWCWYLGYERQRATGRALTDFMTEASGAKWRESFADFFRHGYCERIAYQMVRNGGEIIDVELSATLERDESGHPLRGMCVIEDVTAQRLAERKLRASEAFLERTGKLAGIGGWELDLDSNQLLWSDEVCRIHDVPPGHRPDLEEAIGYYEPEARLIVEAAVQRAFDKGVDWDLELPMRTAKGRRFWGRAIGSVEYEDGRARRLVGALQDITFRKRAVESLEASERRFRKLFQYSQGLICTHDLSGLILSVNPATAISLGYSMSEIMGRRLDEFIEPRFHGNFRAYLTRIAGAGSDSGILKLIAKDGSAREWQYHNVLDDEDAEPYVLGHAQDITDRQRHVQQLRDWSIRDPLTGCFNRRFLSGLSASMGEGDVWGCIAVDLDRFKLVNDTYGHQRGDEVLVAMGGFLQKHLRADDVVVRVGGDEFVVLLKEAEERVTEKIVQRISDDREHAPIAFTLGHAIRRAGMPLEEALGLADKALYDRRALRDA
jgi:diguanylate cyclase (GGDEF)-like protein/PAS domain S-box-containing protein